MAFFGFQSLFTNVIRKTAKIERLRCTFTQFVPGDQVFPLFSVYSIVSRHKKVVKFMSVLTIGIVRDCFYLLIFYSEKFSTWVWRLPVVVNLNLNLSNLEQKRIFQSGTLSPHGVDKCFSFNQFIPFFSRNHVPTKWSHLLSYKWEARISPSSGDYGFALWSRCTRQRLLWLHGTVSVAIPVSSVGGVYYNTTILLVLPL